MPFGEKHQPVVGIEVIPLDWGVQGPKGWRVLGPSSLLLRHSHVLPRETPTRGQLLRAVGTFQNQVQVGRRENWFSETGGPAGVPGLGPDSLLIARPEGGSATRFPGVAVGPLGRDSCLPGLGQVIWMPPREGDMSLPEAPVVLFARWSRCPQGQLQINARLSVEILPGEVVLS